MELSPIVEGAVVFGEDLVTLFLLLQVVELGELEAALIVRSELPAQGDAANIGNIAVYADTTARQRANGEETAGIRKRRVARDRVFRDGGRTPVLFEETDFGTEIITD